MSDLTVNGAAVLQGSLVLRRNGEWWGSLLIDSEEQPSNPLVIESPSGLRLTGWARERGPNNGRVSIEVVGASRPEFSRQLAPVAYRPVGGVRVRTILEDLSRDSGIRLSESIASELLSMFLPAWVRERGSAERAIRSIARALDCSWRFDPDGGLLFVRETWPTVDPDGVQIVERSTTRHTVTVSTEMPLAELVPGVTWQGERVSGAEVYLLPDSTCRTRVSFEFPDQPTEFDRIAGDLNEPAWHTLDERVYSLAYLARVVTQSADLSTVDVELEPDVDPAKRSMPGLVRVPMYSGIPGEVIELRLDGTSEYFCIVTFLNGDRMKPIVSGWLGSPNDNAVKRAKRVRVRGQSIELGEGNARKVARDTDPVGPNAGMTAWMTEVSTRLSALCGTVGPVVIPTALDPLEPPTGNIATIADGSPALKTD